jgi:hypothetical protein
MAMEAMELIQAFQDHQLHEVEAAQDLHSPLHNQHLQLAQAAVALVVVEQELLVQQTLAAVAELDMDHLTLAVALVVLVLS